ncbi:MAG: rod shape-determining protein MreD [Nitrospirae bacterium]|nr:rod shape-determining protein MreD [Nitrospirota bacterium]
MKSALVAVTLLALLIPLQGTLLPWLLPVGWVPDLTLPLIYWVGSRFGEFRGKAAGGILGLLLDLATGRLIGLHLSAKALVGYGAGLWGRQFFQKTSFAHLLALLTLSFLEGIWVLILLAGVLEQPWPEQTAILLPFQAIENALVGILLYRLIDRRGASLVLPREAA